jgi:alkylation response protein AidB-like acyl-CoA dehydrogenase
MRPIAYSLALQTTLRDQGTPEQHKLFLEPAENYKAIGCYAQTEVNCHFLG